MLKHPYFREISAQVSQIMFLEDLTVLRLFTNVWTKMSENSYLREFSAQVSQIVSLADLTVLRLITTVWAKMFENPYLREFSFPTFFHAVLSLLKWKKKWSIFQD